MTNQPHNTPLNVDDGMKMPLGKRKLRELIEDAWYDAPSASAGFGRIEVIIEQQIEAERKKHELEARLDALEYAKISPKFKIEERIVALKQELESL